MARVRPGVELVRAILVPTMVLITLDFPTFDRPRKATSGKLGAGKCLTSDAESRNLDKILINAVLDFRDSISYFPVSGFFSELASRSSRVCG
jgi:hypothetical protein